MRQPYSGTTLRVEANLYLADRPSALKHDESIVLPLKYIQVVHVSATL